MKHFVIRFVVLCVLTSQILATPPVADLVSIVVYNFLNHVQDRPPPKYNLEGQILANINKLAMDIDNLSYVLESEIQQSRLISVSKLYINKLSKCADFIHRQHAIFFDPQSKIFQQFMGENMVYQGMLDRQIENCANAMKAYLKAAADKIEKDLLPACDTRFEQRMIRNEILNAAMIILKGHQLKQISLIFVDGYNKMMGNATMYCRHNVEDEMFSNFEKLKVSLQQLAEQGLRQLARFNAAWGCNIEETRNAIYLKQYWRIGLDKKFCLKPFDVEFNSKVVTVVKFVEVDSVFYLKPLIANFDSHVNKIVEYPHLAWNFSSRSHNCEEQFLYDVQKNSSIILGDIYVPGQVVTGFQLKVRQGTFGPELYLVVVSRIMDKDLRSNPSMYEERYQKELFEQRETTVIEASPAVRPGQTVFYYSYLKPNLTAERIESTVPPDFRETDLELVQVEPGTHIVFKKSVTYDDGPSKLLPPIDVQLITRAPQYPFSGAGFMLLRGDENTSGYVALKLLNGDQKDYIDNLLFTRMILKNVTELHKWIRQKNL